MDPFTLADLRRIMSQVGTDGVDADLLINDVPFAELGFDSLAVLETQARISNEYGVRIPDEALDEMTTASATVAYVNDLLNRTRSR